MLEVNHVRVKSEEGTVEGRTPVTAMKSKDPPDKMGESHTDRGGLNPRAWAVKRR
jgi:hypothetical protein